MIKSRVVDIILLVIIIVFLNFFSLTLIPEHSFLPKSIFLSSLILAGIMLYYLFFKAREELVLLDKSVLIFIISFFLSAFMAKLYWNQSILTSIKSTFYFYIFFLYFVLRFLELPEERVISLIKILFFVSLVVFAIDYLTFPHPLFSYREEERRGGITTFFSGQGFTFLGAFYFLEKFNFKRRPLFLFLFLIAGFFLFFMTQSRMMLIALVLGSLFLILKSSFKHKWLTVILISIVFLGVYYKSNLLSGIKEVNKTQAEYYKENVRIKSHEYYLFEQQGSALTRLFGNGVPGMKGALRTSTLFAQYKGFFASDVGITGIYNYFGLPGVLIWLLFFYFVFKSKGDNFIKAYFLAISTTIFTGYSLFDPGYMPATVLSLYLVGMKNYYPLEEDYCSIEKVSY